MVAGCSAATEAIMPRISMIFISLTAALAFSANAASAGSVTVHTPTPNVKVQVPQTNISSQSGGAGAGKVTVKEIQITKQTDTSSPNLFKNAVTGKHIPTGKITTRKAGVDPVAYDDKTKGGDDKSQESMSLNFTKIQMDYKPQNADGGSQTTTPPPPPPK
jgi:type VI protein secretion system component Hcp